MNEISPFGKKINTVIPFFTEQDFIKSHPTFKINLENLKNMRDDIIHTKSKENSSTVGNSILKKTLNFNYELAIESVAKYINFYEPDKIKECPCDANF
ncbi:MAG: hypothetical protein IPL12_01575 [Bacteroidetes bacterium]|nr:hypothetical protein [Bacteroidota bacterium]